MPAALSAGVALKPQHYEAALAAPADGLFLEVHPENYMVDGGPRLAWLDALRARHALSLHGVSLSLGADAPADPARLARLAALVQRCEPALVSEHLAWSAWRGAYFPDLLPVPRTGEALARIAANVARVQDVLGRWIAVENPSHYLRLGHHWGEVEFLVELARRTGCRLLVDVNNLYVSARNVGASAEAWIDAVPGALVAEIHVAGHSEDPALGPALLVDSHDTPVAPAVWALCERLVRRIGPRPVLLERDADLPPFEALLAERARALAALGAAEACAA